jgi:hypothetical protein
MIHEKEKSALESLSKHIEYSNEDGDNVLKTINLTVWERFTVYNSKKNFRKGIYLFIGEDPPKDLPKDVKIVSALLPNKETKQEVKRTSRILNKAFRNIKKNKPSNLEKYKYEDLINVYLTQILSENISVLFLKKIIERYYQNKKIVIITNYGDMYDFQLRVLKGYFTMIGIKAEIV